MENGTIIAFIFVIVFETLKIREFERKKTFSIVIIVIIVVCAIILIRFETNLLNASTSLEWQVKISHGLVGPISVTWGPNSPR